MKLLIVMLLAAIGLAGANAQTQLSVQPREIETGTSDTIVVSVSVSAVDGLYASSVTLAFDPSVIRVVGWRHGSFLESNPGGAAVHYETAPLLPAAADSFRVDQIVFAQTSASGGGVLFSVLFVPVTDNATAIHIRSARLRDAANRPIETSLEDGTVTVDFARLSIKAMLEGACIGDCMKPAIAGMLPLSQPYSAAPWNYHGNETLPEDFFSLHPDIVDWVLVELRATEEACMTRGRKAGLLTTSGDIVDIDGTSPLRVPVPDHQSYFIVVRHRNHLPVMSSKPVWVAPPAGVYDFTSAMSQAFGAAPMELTSERVCCLISGDADGDGQITGTDFNLFFPGFTSIAGGYLPYDFNLDGVVTGTDFNFYFQNFSAIRSSRVPE